MIVMGKGKSVVQYERELRKEVKERKGLDACPSWLYGLVHDTAVNCVLRDKVEMDLFEGSLTSLVVGSMGQTKTEVNPLLPYLDKINRTLLQQRESLGLSYAATPSKMNESVAEGGSEDQVAAAVLNGRRELDDLSDLD